MYNFLTTSEENKFWIKILWLIRMRWAVLVFSIVLIGASKLPKEILSIDVDPIKKIIVILAIFNSLFFVVHKIVDRKKKMDRKKKGNYYPLYLTIFFAQIIVDYVCSIILVLHFGFTSLNLSILFLPHLIITSILFENRVTPFIVMWCSLITIFITMSFVPVELHPGEPIFFNPKVTLALFTVGIFHFVYYLTTLLSNMIARSRNELLEKNKQLRSMDQEKQRYTLRATHELKAPFAAIQSYAHVLLGGYAGEINPKAMEIIKKMDERCNTLSDMIKNIIQLSNLKTSIFKEEDYTFIPIIDYLDDKISRYKVTAGDKGVNIKLVTTLKRKCEVKVALKLYDILWDNLIANAINYSFDNTDITISVKRDQISRHIEVSIHNQGIGISEKNFKNIFKEHFRSNKAVEHYHNGNGMGLAIVQEISRLHGGEILVKSEIDKYAKFTLKMPLNCIDSSAMSEV